MSRDELVERFTLERVGRSAATFDYDKLDWMNGVYLRELSPDAYADRLVTYLREQGIDWDEERIRAAAPLVQEKIAKLGEFPDFAGFLFHDVEPDPALLDPDVLAAAAEALERVEPFTAERIEAALKELCERLGLKPRQALPADPGCRHRLEGVAGALREPGAPRPRGVARSNQPRGRGGGLSGASGSRARWNSAHARRR